MATSTNGCEALSSDIKSERDAIRLAQIAELERGLRDTSLELDRVKYDKIIDKRVRDSSQ